MFYVRASQTPPARRLLFRSSTVKVHDDPHSSACGFLFSIVLVDVTNSARCVGVGTCVASLSDSADSRRPQPWPRIHRVCKSVSVDVCVCNGVSTCTSWGEWCRAPVISVQFILPMHALTVATHCPLLIVQSARQTRFIRFVCNTRRPSSIRCRCSSLCHCPQLIVPSERQTIFSRFVCNTRRPSSI